MESQYQGSLGIDDAELELRWDNEVKVKGTLTVGNKKYRVMGDNSLKGTIFANVFGNLGHVGAVLLKRSDFQGISWTGICYFNSGEKKLLTVKRDNS
jgi:hypothetical protein